MSLKSVAICACIVFHRSSNAFSTTSMTPQFQHNIQYIVKGGETDGTALSMVQASGGAEKLSKVEALLAKAKELRAQAEADESQLHSSLLEKKSSQDMETDITIDELFPISLKESITVEAISERLTNKRLSKDMLLRVVERLHRREIAAKGLERVEQSVGKTTHVTFETIAEGNEEDLARVEGLIELLIDAAEIVDEEFLRNQLERRGENGKVVMHNIDHTHWSSGELSKVLREKANFLGREYDEQFKNRLAEYYEAARKKKGSGNFQMEL